MINTHNFKQLEYELKRDTITNVTKTENQLDSDKMELKQSKLDEDKQQGKIDRMEEMVNELQEKKGRLKDIIEEKETEVKELKKNFNQKSKDMASERNSMSSLVRKRNLGIN